MKASRVLWFIFLVVLLIFAWWFFWPVKVNTSLPVALKCEYLENPLGIDEKNPRLSWIVKAEKNNVKQSAWQILVAGSKNLLEEDSADIWDSGKINGDSSMVKYGGKPLKSRETCYWKIRFWDQHDVPSMWSMPASWEMGLFERDWQAQWTGAVSSLKETKADIDSAPMFRKTFDLEKTGKGRVYVSGLGYYELYINGKRVGDHVLSPNHSNYDRRQSEDLNEPRVGNMSRRVYYETYDVTSFLKAGENAIGIWLGNGWYNQNDREEDRPFSYDTPRFILQLEVEKHGKGRETVVSDASWKTSTGPILYSGIYTGEIYDARLEMPGWDETGFDDSSWGQAVTVRPPSGKLMAQQALPDRIVRTVRPVAVSQPDKNVWRYDMGEVISGWVRLRVKGREGTKLVLKYSEDFGFNYGQTDTYILNGYGTETWEPRFTWHAFRYVDIFGAPFRMTQDMLTGVVVHTDVPDAGMFACSNNLFNRIEENYRRTQLGNMHGGVPSDCPHRERRGYTGDGQIAAEAAIYNFDMAAFYTKWVDDIADAQNAGTGYVPNTAPFQHGGGGVAWGSAYVIIPWYIYLYYGDTRILKKHYAGMKKYVDYLAGKRDEDGLIIEPALGVWAAPDPVEVPPALVSTAYFYHILTLMSDICRVADHAEDRAYFEYLAEMTNSAFNKHYFRKDQNSYSIGRQGANVFALGFGLVPDSLRNKVFQTLVHHIEHDTKGHFDTGMMATPLLLDVLTESGRQDLAYTVMNQRDFPGFGLAIDMGATTLWETWRGSDSHDHPMYGSVCRWFFRGLAGIRPDPERPGFSHIIIRPGPVRNLQETRALYHSVRGTIESHWLLKDQDFVLKIEIPANTEATVFIPAKNISGVNVKGKEVVMARMQDGMAVYNVPSGKYEFVSHDAVSLLSSAAVSSPVVMPGDTLAFFGDTVMVRMKTSEGGLRIHYTMDGSPPGAGDPVYKNPFPVFRTCMIRARAFRGKQGSGLSKVSRIDFIDAAKNGLNYKYYEGAWQKLPAFSKLRPLRTGRVCRLDLQEVPVNTNKFALLFTGKLKIEKTDDYTFWLNSNDGSRLFIDGRLVIDHDGLHGAEEKEGKIHLDAGSHSIRVEFFQAGGGIFLQLLIEGGGMKKQPVPPNLTGFQSLSG